MNVIIGLIIALAVPFLVLQIFYKKALALGLLVVSIISLWLFAFANGVMATILFEPPGSTHFRDYEAIMPASRAHEYYMWLKFNPASIADNFPLLYWFLFDLFYISTHYLFTFSKWPLWVFLFLAGYIIKVLILGSYWYFLPEREYKIKQPEKHPINVFGRREISLADEEEEVLENLERIRSGKPMK